MFVDYSFAAVILLATVALFFLFPFLDQHWKKSRSKPDQPRRYLYGSTVLLLVLIGLGFTTLLTLLASSWHALIYLLGAFSVLLVLAPLMFGRREDAGRFLGSVLLLVTIFFNFFVFSKLFLVAYEFASGFPGDAITREDLLTVYLSGIVSLCLIGFLIFLDPSKKDSDGDIFQQLAHRVTGGDLKVALLISLILVNALQLFLIEAMLARDLEPGGFILTITYLRTPIPLICFLFFLVACSILWVKVLGLSKLQGELESDQPKALVGRMIAALPPHNNPVSRSLAQERQIFLADVLSDQGLVVVRYIGWAIPTFGFIGTVYGLSQAVSELGSVLVDDAASGAGNLNTELARAVAPMAIAFDTTLVALPLGLIVMMLHTISVRWETGIFGRLDHKLHTTAAPQ